LDLPWPPVKLQLQISAAVGLLHCCQQLFTSCTAAAVAAAVIF
jgi:hypothetical protein